MLPGNWYLTWVGTGAGIAGDGGYDWRHPPKRMKRMIEKEMSEDSRFSYSGICS